MSDVKGMCCPGANLAHEAASHGVTDEHVWAILGEEQVDILAPDSKGQVPADLAKIGGHAEKFKRKMSVLGFAASTRFSRRTANTPLKEEEYEDDFE